MLRLGFVWFSLGAFFALGACHRSSEQISVAPPVAAEPEESDFQATDVADSGKTERPRLIKTLYATWYAVPVNSLAHRRAALGEMTAAHDHLPLGTRLRVINLQSGKDVIVRITDRGVHHRKAQLDLCREAAEQLDIVGQGIAKVRMEVLPKEVPPVVALP
jgi:rare lipoprotein A (peptidoglycan hydrolase)